MQLGIGHQAPPPRRCSRCLLTLGAQAQASLWGMGNSCSRVFCCCCGRSRYEQADAHTQPLAVLSPTQNTLADVLERSIQARSAAWAQLGKARPIPTTHLKASANSERQKWPSVRQSYQLVERGNGTTILASDGLSDPFDDITLGVVNHLKRSAADRQANRSTRDA